MKIFTTPTGQIVPSVTAEEMADVDRLATARFGLDILQMMENAGRQLAASAWPSLPADDASVTVVAGGGGNGGGGLAASRHLLSRGVEVRVVLDRPPEGLAGPAAHQWRILAASGVEPVGASGMEAAIASADVVLDALIGYGLRAAPEGMVADLIEACNRLARRIVSLDLPSGLDATDGTAPGMVVRPDEILTLALPKTGLAAPHVDVSDVLLADLGIPPGVFTMLGIAYHDPFRGFGQVRLACHGERRRPCRDGA